MERKKRDEKAMGAKEYLEQLKTWNTKINQKQVELEELRFRSTSLSQRHGQERVQTSGDRDRVGNMAGRIVDLDREIKEEIESFYDRRHIVINQIQGLGVDNYMQILFKKYVEQKELCIIAEEMEKSYPYTLEIHKKALLAFEKTYQILENLS